VGILVGLEQMIAFQKPISATLGSLVLKPHSRTLTFQVADGFPQVNLFPDWQNKNPM
jgi:hypothetical protein